MKQALCVSSFEVLSQLVKKEIETTEVKFIPREICEVAENGHQQLIPYVTFYAVDVEDGKLKMIQYQRKDQGEGESRLAGKTSIGFGGHIDQETDIVSTEVVTLDDNTQAYTMTLKDIIDTGIKAGIREVTEELNVNLSELGIDLSNGETSFFIGDPSIEVNQVHIGFSIQVKLESDQYEQLKAAAKFNEVEIQQLDTLGINLDVIIEEMDISNSLGKLIRQLVENHGLEDWSAKIFNYVVRKEINEIVKFVTYKDFVAIGQAKAAIIAQQQAEQSAEGQDAQEVSVPEEAVSNG